MKKKVVHNWELAVTGLPYEHRFSSNRQYKTLVADCSRDECLQVLSDYCLQKGIKVTVFGKGAFGESINQIGYEGVHDGTLIFGMLVRDDHEWYKK